jgi:ribonuclease BN (tRNA processing enzyme)
MLNLHVIQAEYGDCFLLEFGLPSQPRYMLVDGGPSLTYERHLQPHLRALAEKGSNRLDLVILSHVDNDHLVGLLDLLRELRRQRAENTEETVVVDSLWHNAFGQTLGSGTDIEPRLLALTSAPIAETPLLAAITTVQGIAGGHELRLHAIALGIEINPGFRRGVVLADDPMSLRTVDNLQLRILGPTKASLDALKKEWQDWLEGSERGQAARDPLVMAQADRSIPNLSSIAVLAEADGKSILFAGDSRGDHLLMGLDQAGVLDASGSLHVNVVKLPHHGSARSISRTFLQKVTADTYVLSANGRDEHPDLATLIWIVESARMRRQPVEIVVTNETFSTRRLMQDYVPHMYGYRLTVMEAGAHAMRLSLSD